MNLSITSSAPKATPTVEPRTSLSLPPQSGNIKKADRNPPHRKISSEIGAMNTPQKLSNSYGDNYGIWKFNNKRIRQHPPYRSGGYGNAHIIRQLEINAQPCFSTDYSSYLDRSLPIDPRRLSETSGLTQQIVSEAG
ncbi:unnamed protein product [Dracunculus medinensis]|uniref:Uncharacterized protein n=1 Tax=Dracunculus medinensis TaxID=318479 RepID=A0A0N4ULV7_DRAME|nr:unnamed protein product [Dracunculus medinensis]